MRSGEIRRPDRGVHGGRHRAAPHDADPRAVQEHRVAVARDRLGLAHPEPDEASRHALEPLALECGQAREGRALLELHDPAEPGFVRRHGGVDVAAVQRIARLEPQCVARAQPTRFRAPRPDQRVPQLLEVRPAAVQLEPVFAGVPGAGNEALHPRHLALGEVVVRDHRHPDGRERGEQGLRARALHREQAGVVRDVAQPHVGAALLLHDVLPVPRDVRGVHDHHQPVLEPVHETVVHERALLGQDRGILGLPGAQGPDIVTRHALHEGVAVGAGDLELTHVRDVEHAHALAHRPVLGRDPRGVAHGHLVAAERHHLGAQAHVNVVQRSALHPSRVASSAFWTCSRFSASSHTRDCGPSITSVATSSPRCAGRQWRKMAPGAASFISSASTV